MVGPVEVDTGLLHYYFFIIIFFFALIIRIILVGGGRSGARLGSLWPVIVGNKSAGIINMRQLFPHKLVPQPAHGALQHLLKGFGILELEPQPLVLLEQHLQVNMLWGRSMAVLAIIQIDDHCGIVADGRHGRGRQATLAGQRAVTYDDRGRAARGSTLPGRVKVALQRSPGVHLG